MGLGTASSLARVGAIATPFIAAVVTDISVALPLAIFAAAAAVCTTIAVLLPVETHGRTLQDAIE